MHAITHALLIITHTLLSPSYIGREIKPWFVYAFLNSLGWHCQRHSRTIYFDGHERPDVVERRREFLAEMAEFEKMMSKYSGPDCMTVTAPTLAPGQTEHVLVVHDESTFYTNDDEKYEWCEDGKGHSLKFKNDGGSCNSSKFLSEKGGRVRMSDEQYANYKRDNPDGQLPQDSGVEMKCGSKYATSRTGKTLLGVEHDGWWTNDLVVAQLKQTIDIFEITHPDQIGVFLFDNSTGHNAFADDALIARKMNSLPGGKQPLMRETVFDGHRQSLVFEQGDVLLFECTINIDGDKCHFRRGTPVGRRCKLLGLAKGSRQVSLERGYHLACGRTKKGKAKYIRHCCGSCKKSEDELVEDEILKAAGLEDQIVNKIKHAGLDERGRPCCVVWQLEQCEDFAGQLNAVEETIKARGHKCIFLPKFHPELNYIERFWGHCKRWLRKHCLYSMVGLWSNFEKVFSEEVSPISLLRKFARTAWRWMDVYRRDLPADVTAFAAKSYHGHRGIPASLDQLVDDLKRFNQRADAVKLERLIEGAEKRAVVEQRSAPLVVDPTSVHPDRFVGVVLKKEFDGFGVHEGRVVSHDLDMLGNTMYRVEYVDGDVEDLFLEELVRFVAPSDLLVCINNV